MKPANHENQGRNNLHKLLVILSVVAIFCIYAASLVHAAPGNETSAPVILSKSPEGLTNQNPVLMELVTDKPATCRYHPAPVAFSEMTGNFTLDSGIYYAELDLPDGQHTYHVACQDEHLNTSSPEQLSFTLDTTPPQATQSGPSGIHYTKTIKLELTTTENAVCRFDTSDIGYDALQNTFSKSGQKIHSHQLTITKQGTHTYYALCRDPAGNTMQQSIMIAFEINFRPTASIHINGEEMLNDGTYTVHLTASEELSAIPTLQYNFNDEPGLKTLSLTGSGTQYHGYIIIPKTNKDRIGTFFFTGKDLDGLEGNEITSGKLFLVDTKDPDTPVSITLENTKKGVKVTWYYDGEPINYYRIYRADTGNVDFSKYYDRSTSDVYYDLAAEEGATYSYKIAAVDKAGNTGPLSAQRSITVRYIQEDEKPAKQMLSPHLSGSVKTLILDIDSALLDLDSIALTYSMQNDAALIKAIEHFDATGKARNAAENLKKLRAELEGYLAKDMEQTEVENRIKNAENQMKTLLDSVIVEIKVVSESELTQLTQQSDVFSATTEILKQEKLSTAQRADYDTSMAALNDEVKVNTHLINVDLLYYGNSRKEGYSIVKKTVRSDAQKGFVLELIPKAIASSPSQITFKDQPAIVTTDPLTNHVMKWVPASLQQFHITYHLKQTDINLLKTTKTIVLDTPPAQAAEIIEDRNNTITGMVGKTGKKPVINFDLNFVLLLLGVICVLGLAVYYAFFLKNEEAYEQEASGEKYFKQGKNTMRRRIVEDVQDKPGKPEARRVSGVQHPLQHPLQSRLKSRLHSRKNAAGTQQNQTDIAMSEDQELQVLQNITRNSYPEDNELNADIPEGDSASDANLQLFRSQTQTNMAAGSQTQTNRIRVVTSNELATKIPAYSVSGIHEMLSLIDEAHLLADKMEFKKATAFYLTILDLYDHLGENARIGIAESLNGLYYKLLLRTKIAHAHRCVDMKDKAELHRVLYQLEDLSQMCGIHKDSSLLSNHLSKAKTYFHDTLKNMRHNQSSYMTYAQSNN